MSTFVVDADFNVNNEKILFKRKKMSGSITFDSNCFVAKLRGRKAKFSGSDISDMHMYRDADGTRVLRCDINGIPFCYINSEIFKTYAWAVKNNSRMAIDMMHRKDGQMKSDTERELRIMAENDDEGRSLPRSAVSMKNVDKPTLRWLEAANAVYRRANMLPWDKFGGCDDGDIWGRTTAESILREGWNVKSRADSEIAVNFLIFECAEFPDAWNTVRVIQLAQFCYTAGYINLEEAMDKALWAAELIKAEYGSWDEVFDDYVKGYAEEFPDDEKGIRIRREARESLKNEADGPYQVPFKTPLVMTR